MWYDKSMALIQGYRGKIISYIKNAKNHPDIVTIELIFLNILIMGKLVLDRYDALYVFAYDFGVFDQAIWSTSRGELMWQTINTVSFGSHFGTHFQPLLILLAPLNYIFSDGRFLLIIQTIFLALGALPLYLIAKIKFKSEWMPAVFPFLYLLYPYLHNVNLYDFHGVSFSPFFIGLVWYSIEKENINLFTVSALMSLLIKENLFVIVTLVCIYAFFKTPYKLKTAILAAFSIVYGLVIINFTIPAFLGKPYLFADGTMVKSVILNPPSSGLFEITKELFKPLLFLPLLNPIPYLTSIILLIRQAAVLDIRTFLFFHYPAEIIPLVFISLILGISNIPNYVIYINKALRKGEIKYNFERLFLVICSLLIISSGYFFLTASQATNLYSNQYKQTEHDRIGINLLKQIPPDAVVAAQGHLVPRLSHRKYIFILPEIPEEYKDNIEYIVFDIKAESNREI